MSHHKTSSTPPSETASTSKWDWLILGAGFVIALSYVVALYLVTGGWR